MLLMEDNPGDARLFEELLREGELDAECRREASLQAGLEALREGRPDIVVVDLDLPDSVGLETVRRVAGAAPDLPVVVTTGLDDLETATAALDAGASEYLRKDGLTPALLARTLRMALERHRLQRKAERERELSRSILESVPEHIAVLDARGEIVATNEAWRRFAEAQGGDPRGYVGENYLEETRRAAEKGSGDAEEMLEGLEAVLSDRRDQFEMEYPCHGPDERRWFRVSVVPLRDEERSGVVVSHINITDRKLAEEKLLRSRGRHRRAQEIADLGHWERDLESGEFVRSEQVSRILGVEGPLDPTADAFLERVHPDDRGRLRRLFEELIEGERSSYEATIRVVRLDGEVRWIDDRGERSDGRLTGTIQDVTDRRRREQELEEATSKLRERVKEQSCLYDVSKLLHADDRELDAVLQDVADRLPEGWQYPEVAAGRIRIDDRSWSSPGFEEVDRCLSAAIGRREGELGRVEVAYLEERPEEDLGPFIEEERQLLRAIAEQIAIAVDRRRARRELEAERARLAEVFEHGPAWVATLRGPEQVFEMANAAFHELVGDREVVGRPAREVFPELEGEGYFERLDRVYRTGETVEVEEYPLVLERDGRTERQYISFVYQPRREDGEVVGVIAHGIDVTEQVEKREQAREAEEKWASVVDLAPVGIVISDAETGRFYSVNRAVASMLGYEPEDALGRTADDLDVWVDPSRRDELIGRLRAGEVVRNEPVRFRHRSGEVRHVLVSVRGLEIAGEGRLLWTTRDVTERRERRTALRESEARYRTLVETMAEATIILDREGRVTFANAEAEELLGLGDSEATGRTYNDPDWRITAPDGGSFPDSELPFRRVLETGEAVRNVEHAIVTGEGSRRVLAVNAAPLRENGSGPGAVVATIRDITEQKELEDQLQHQALHDPLTGIANRALFEDRLEQALARSRRSGALLGLLMVDIDGFKRINDHLGHTAGDQVLREVSRRLESAVRETDTVARWGGDEFALVLPGLDDPSGLHSLEGRIRERVESPIAADDDRIEISVTVGAVLHGEADDPRTCESEEAADLVRFADLALHQAKSTAPGGFDIYRPGEEVDAVPNLRLEQELRRGLEADQIVVFYQPIYSLEDESLQGLEALARWRHPDRGLVSPGTFIPLAERVGLIDKVGASVCEQAFEHMNQWTGRGGGGSGLQIALNLSARQLTDRELPEQVEAWLASSGLPPGNVVFEITETALMQASGAVADLRSLGVRIYIDDFGTGYSTFSYLKELSVDGLKVDMQFVQDLPGSASDAAIVDSMATLGRQLGINVIAEGIETAEQLEAVRELECGFGQGFYLGRPGPPERVGRLLNGGEAADASE